MRQTSQILCPFSEVDIRNWILETTLQLSALCQVRMAAAGKSISVHSQMTVQVKAVDRVSGNDDGKRKKCSNNSCTNNLQPAITNYKYIVVWVVI